MWLIFDMDGVILDSAKIKLESFMDVFSKAGIKNKFSDEELLSSSRPSKIFSKFFQNTSAISKVYSDIYEEKLTRDKNYFISLESLKDLKNKDLNLALFTTQPKRRVDLALPKEYQDIFDKIITEESISGCSKENSKGLDLIIEEDLEESVFVGDSVDDIRAANKKGILSIFVLWGYTSESIAKLENPNFIVKNSKELFLLLKKILGGKNGNRMLCTN